MPIDSPQHQSVPPRLPEPPHRRRVIATVALIVALLALAFPAASPGVRFGGATAASVPPAAHQLSSSDAPASFERGRAPAFFGFLEFDWDPDAPGGVPGFDPWPGSHRHR
jgi:hypothetical protein